MASAPLSFDQFTVLTHGSSTGRFATPAGLDLGDGLNLLLASPSGQTLLARLSWQRISVNPTALSAAEGGERRAYRIFLAQRSTATVRITSTADPQFAPSVQDLFFAAAGWQAVQQLRVEAADNSLVEGSHAGVATHLAQSADFNLEGYLVASVGVEIADNDPLPLVRVGDASGARAPASSP